MHHGKLESVSWTKVTGWAMDDANPDTPVSLVVSIDHVPVGHVLADRPHKRFARAGNSGRHGFELTLGGGLAFDRSHTVAVQRESDGGHLSRSPMQLEPAAKLDTAAREHLARMIAAVKDDDEIGMLAQFLADQANNLLHQRANRLSRRDDRSARRQYRDRLIEAPSPDAPHSFLERLPRALFIDKRLPTPDQDAGSQAILSHMRSLQRLGFEISFAATGMPAGGEDLQAMGFLVYGRPFCASVEEILRRQPDSFDLIYLHRVEVAAQYINLARDLQRRARLVFSVADLEHLRLRREGELDKRPELLALSQRRRADELTAVSLANVTITHSSHEAGLLHKEVPRAAVRVVPWAIVPKPTAIAFAQRGGLAFIGGYAHSPNVDAARWLVREIMPLVWREKPDIACLLVGSNMPPSLRALAGPKVIAMGQVPDLAAVFDRVRLTVAPMAYGAGVKGKVLDSMAAGIPCVCTPCAAEGIDFAQALIAADAQGMADAILRLHDDEALNNRIAAAGLEHIATHNHPSRIDAVMRALAGLPAAAPQLSDRPAR